ncbi:hypothetical protein M422DRAFT_30994 [Sphaerobolus stellatus SS14]|uniref:Uncharacterized protein n=1 Tax=Sphaerobolus stellatus (strain SS14) TaxID=990650 RepID=A0A0C9VWD7_SPHS4|nr:hypothetical protein M422DRAFT_30994 [Sphaerobolus stellatus SS14]
MLSRGANPHSSGTPFTTATPSTNDPLLKKTLPLIFTPSSSATATPPRRHTSATDPSRRSRSIANYFSQKPHQCTFGPREESERIYDIRRLPSNMCSARLGLPNASSQQH